MSTLVCFHAHPDDEVIATGGVMAKAHAAGHRVVLVVATRGERGEVAPGFLSRGEALWERRVGEVEEAARILGVAETYFLGYVDSGMMGEATNDDPACFWQADIGEAAERLAAILQAEGADALTVYDHNGNYGHPDHIQVHRVGVAAADLAGTSAVFEATIDRDRMRSLLEVAAAGGRPGGVDPEVRAVAEAMVADDGPTVGSPASAITTRVDVRTWLPLKRRAMAAHASQITADSWFLRMPDDAFAEAFGEECFIRRGAADGLHETDLFG
jgi:LmbE family N-acetylglucosaminyl deacetylase